MTKSKNLKSGAFTKNELALYKLDEAKIKTILKYQKLLPILQQEDGNKIDGRELHDQLKVGRDYSTWIQEQLQELDAIEGVDYSPLKGKTPKAKKGRPKTDYLLTLATAKEIAMIAGVKGGRTNPELKSISHITRKYFIFIEEAFRNRTSWNLDRESTIIKCKELKHALIVHSKDIKPSAPSWVPNQFIGEFCLLNDVILGMSASEYRRLNGLKSSYPIRNTFDEKQLEWVNELEKYDSDLIKVQEIFDYNKRKAILTKKFNLMSKKSISIA